MQQIGERIKKARQREGVTQEVLSKSIGVTSQYLSDLERGLVGTSITTLIKICEQLNVTSDHILFDNGDKDVEDIPVISRIRYLRSDQLEIVERTLNLLLKAMDMEPDRRMYGKSTTSED